MKLRFHRDQDTQARTHRRIIRLVITGAVLFGVVLAGGHFWLARPVGEGPAGPPVPEEPFGAVWSTRQVILLGLGDSVTAGYGAAKEKSYIARLASNPPDEFPDMQGRCLGVVLPQLRVYDCAVSGSNSFQHEEHQIRELTPFPREAFGIVAMTTGGNDLIHWYGRKPPAEGAMYGADLAQAKPWIENFERRLDGMLVNISALFPGGCAIFLANIYDPSDGGADPRLAGLPLWKDATAILAAYNEVIARCAARHENVCLVDIHQLFLGHGVRCSQFWRSFYHREDPHYWYFGNIEDPNERGYDALRRIFLLKIIEKLADPASPLRATK